MKLTTMFPGLRFTCSILFTAVIVCTLVSCGGDEDPKNKPDTSYQSPVKSAKIIDEIHARQFPLSSDHDQMAGLILPQIEEIRTYCNIEGWNSGADIENRHSTHHETIAKALNIPVSKIKAAERYYRSAIMTPLDSIIKALYSKPPGIEIDYYGPLQSTAWCGMHTIITELIVYGGSNETEIKDLAAKQATDMIAGLPEWVDGVKFNRVTHKDTLLQTTDHINAGFIWRRGGELKPMPESRSGFGRMPAERCTIWYNNEWNDKKKIIHPAYQFLKPVVVVEYK